MEVRDHRLPSAMHSLFLGSREGASNPALVWRDKQRLAAAGSFLVRKHPMNRRNLVFAVITAALSAGIASRTVASDADSATAFLHDLYEREIERHNKKLPPDNAAFMALFTREMRELMNAPRLPDPNVSLGPILHAMFGRGVLPGTEVILSGVTTVRDDASLSELNVALTHRGEVRNLVVSLLRQDGAWRIQDIAYGPGDTLAGHYKRTTGR
jgi:hypothetical protein